MRAITQSILGNADKCMLSAQYTLDTPVWFKTVGSAARAVGTGYHSGLELLYQTRLDGVPSPPLVTILAWATYSFDQEMATDSYTKQPVETCLWDDKIPDRNAAFELIGAMLTEYVEGGHAWPLDWKVLSVETRYKAEAYGLSLSGAADLVLEDPNGWIIGVDNKTAGKAWPAGKESPRKNNQAGLYVALLRNAFPDAPGYRMVFDIMQYPTAKFGPRFERRSSDPQPKHEQAILRKARDFAFMYEIVHEKAGMDLPANPASTLCNPKWCDFFAGCAYGAALDN